MASHPTGDTRTPSEIRSIVLAELRLQGLSPAEVAFAMRVGLGESDWNPHVRVSDPAQDGSPGFSHGIFQLRSPGLLDTFTGQGFNDWRDPIQQARFVARYVKEHRNDGYSGWEMTQNRYNEFIEPDWNTEGRPRPTERDSDLYAEYLKLVESGVVSV